MTHSHLFAVSVRLLCGEHIAFRDAAGRRYVATSDRVRWLGAGRGAEVCEGDAYDVAGWVCSI